MATSELIVDINKFYRDAFTNPSIKLYLPTNDKGEIVAVDKATRLEHWIDDTMSYSRQIPDVLDMDVFHWSHVLLKRDDEEEYAFFIRSVAYGTIKAWNEWTHHLRRETSGDQHSFTAKLKG